MKRFIIFYMIVTALVLIVDIYAFQAIKSVTRELSPSTRRIINIIYWSVTVFTLLTLTTALFIQFEQWPKALRSYLFSSIVVIYLSKLFIIPILLLEDVIRTFTWIINLFTTTSDAGSSNMPAIPRSKFLGQFAVFFGGIPLVLGLHGMIWNAYNYKIHRVKVALPHLPEAFNGLKIIQISDIHSGSFISKSAVKKGVDLINRQKPDLVFFTGDIVNYKAEEMYDFIDIFREIKAKEGVYSIFGNHDYADYVRYESKEEAIRKKRENRELLSEIHKSMGWQLLLNENRILRRGNDSMAIIGSENWSANGRFSTYGDLRKASRDTEDAQVKLLLSHDPTHWSGEVIKKYKDIDITFSGHTHGAQFGVEIPGFIRWSPSQYIYPHWGGLYKEAHQYLYVNRGFGFIGYHGRIGILPEITVMELEKG